MFGHTRGVELEATVVREGGLVASEPGRVELVDGAELATEDALHHWATIKTQIYYYRA